MTTNIQTHTVFFSDLLPKYPFHESGIFFQKARGGISATILRERFMEQEFRNNSTKKLVGENVIENQDTTQKTTQKIIEFMRQNPNVNINYSKPDLNKVYPFIKFPIINLPKPNGVKHVKKSAISENLKRAHNSLKDLTKLSKKIISNTGELGRKQINNAKNAITAKNVGKNISKNTPKNISKDIIKSFENKNF